MQIKNRLNESYIDFPENISSVVFTGTCNYKCPTCHAKYLLESKEKNMDELDFFNYLDSRKGWIDAVVICGGEPTLQSGLINFARELKEKKWYVKLDTNGSRPEVLKNLLEKNLIDYVAMDVKGPSRLYAKLVGKDFIDEKEDVGKGIEIVSQFPDYEFRTTVVPIIRENKKISFMTPEEIGETAKLICNYTGKRKHKYFLQRFVASRSNNEMLDRKFERKNLPKEFWETPRKLLWECLHEARKYLPDAELRED